MPTCAAKTSARYGTTKLTGKYQLTLPRNVREHVNAQLGTDILVRALGPDRIELVLLLPARSFGELAGSLRVRPDIREQLRGKDLTEGVADFVTGISREPEPR